MVETNIEGSPTGAFVCAMKGGVLRQKSELARAVRAYAKAQVASWRRIPWLLFERMGKRGCPGIAERAYRYGYFSLDWHGSAASPHVDCATGDLVYFAIAGAAAPPKPLSDNGCIALAEAPESLDAEEWISRIAQLQDDVLVGGRTPEEHARQRQEMIETYGIAAVFQPSNPRAYPYVMGLVEGMFG